MNLFRNKPKLLEKKEDITYVQVPAETKSIQLLTHWEVRWLACKGVSFSNLPDVKEQVAVFTNVDDALAFKDALKNAFLLLKQTFKTDISLTRVN